MDTGLVESFVENTDDDGTDKGAGDRTNTTTETGASYYDSRYGIEFKSCSRGWFGGVELGGVDKTCDAGKDGAECVDGDFNGDNGNTAEAGCFAVSANGIDMLSVTGPVKDDGEEGEKDEHDEYWNGKKA